MRGWNQQIDNLNHHKYFRACAFVLIAIGFFTGHPILFFIGSVYLSYFLVSYFYLLKVGDRLQFTILEEQIKLFPGEEGKLTLKITQPGILPVFLGEIVMVVDNNIHIQNGEMRTHISQKQIPFSLLGRSERLIEIPFTARERGIAKIHHIEIKIGHFMDAGKVYLQKNDVTKFEAIVYSDQRIVSGLERIVPKNQGAYPTRASLFEDNSTIIGTRDYAHEDSFNKIHWKASARMASLQTKMFEKTSQFSWLVVLDIRSANFEERIKGVTFLLHHATKFQIPFSLLINIKKVGNPSYLELSYGEGKGQLQAALTLLARLQSNSVSIGMPTFERITYKHSINSPYIIICAESERLNGWEMSSSSNVYRMDVSEENCALHPWHSVKREEVAHA